ncbi:MAG TPA: FmdE family protein [Syntrophomonadaceae bacterium]|jgi:formylmethanofuran dehydrogenase subunit E|nr:FmdE family protein [Syntrophomonadaceae bacterium]HPU49412.1 FmdE family protein [Syntrophomonadaceae bacterium]
MCKDMSPLEKAIQFHGHICPGLLLGVRAAEMALDYLQIDSDQYDEVGAIVENDTCGADAIQAILGCTFGKGNLYFKDYGKMVYTVFNRQNGRAIRIAQNFDALEHPVVERYRELKGRDFLDPQEEMELEDALAQVFELIMSQPLEQLFHWREVEMPQIGKARTTKNVQCRNCGEGVMQTHAVLTEEGLLCPECHLNWRGENYVRG